MKRELLRQREAERGLADGLPGRGAERAQQLSVMHEVGAKEFRDGEHPLGVADVGAGW